MKKGKILVIKTSDLFPNGILDGFLSDKNEAFLNLIREKSFYMERSEAEKDADFQQIIPQIVLTVKGKIFIHKIPTTGNEGRLHDMWPIFLGGHVDETDLDIEVAVKREFEEEINYMGRLISKKYLGIIKLHDTEVNKVHVGLIYIYEGDAENFELKGDDGVADPRFVSVENLKKYENKMTYWSKAFYPYLIKFI